VIQAIKDIFEIPTHDIFGAAEDEKSVAPGVRHRPPRILLAEDDAEMRRCLAQAFRKADFEVEEAEHGTRVLDYIVSWLITGEGLDIDLVVSDIRMPGADGLRLLTALRSHRHDLPVILITAFGNPETHIEAKLRGAAAVLDKPFAFAELLAAVRGALANREPTNPRKSS
jgi:DNA-binding response OmpR family regulator